MQSDDHFIQFFNAWREKLRELSIRGLIIADVESLRTNQLIDKIKSDEDARHFNYGGTDSKALASEKAETMLGDETQTILFNIDGDFDVNAFAALSGTLAGGGVLVLLLPSHNMPVVTKYLSNRYQSAISSTAINPNSFHTKSEYNGLLCPVLERLIKFNLETMSTAVIVDNDFLYCQSLLGWQPEKLTNGLQQQALIVEKIKRVARGHANRPLVLTANRGRGKSAALGIASADLVQQKPTRIIVTAPRLKNLASFYLHLYLNLNDFADKPSKPAKKLQLPNGSLINFIPVDEIIRSCPSANLLIIDEAAAIPVSQLEQLCGQFNRIVFATTSHGYEGNGKGFELRFKKRLLALKPATRFATLEAPIRWAIHDQFETACFQALLLDCHLTKVESTPETAIYDELKYEQVNKNQIVNEENTLRTLFALLVNAHYQTRPKDLQSILSDDKLKIFVARLKQQIVAVSLVSVEGNLEQSTIQNISQGKQRLKGDLLAQSLVVHSGVAQAGSLKFYRVMRIAVHPELQNQGIGSWLLTKIKQTSQQDKVDFLGASFAASNDVVRFWLANQFDCIRFGNARDSSSGNYTLEVLKPLTQQAQLVSQQLNKRFNRAFPLKLQRELADLELAVIRTVLEYHIHFKTQPITDFDIHELALFVEGKRGYSAIDDLLINYFKQILCHAERRSLLSLEEKYLLIDSLILQSDFQLIIQKFNFSGKKQLIKRLRELTKKLLPS